MNKYLKEASEQYDKIQKWKNKNNYGKLDAEEGMPTDYEDWIKEFARFAKEIERKKNDIKNGICPSCNVIMSKTMDNNWYCEDCDRYFERE